MKKDVYQARSWLVTQPADGEHGMSHERLLAALESAHLSAVGQLEKGGKTGYLHWQLLIERESGAPIRFSRLRAIFPHGHYEPRRGTLLQAIDYVTKSETRACPPVSISRGEIRRDQGKRTDLDEFYDAITAGQTVAEVIADNPRACRYARSLETLQDALMTTSDKAKKMRPELRVYWIYGAPGVGKTYAVTSLGDVFRVSDYRRDPFGRYQGEDTLVLDEYSGQLDYELFLQLSDIYPLELPCRYRNKIAMFSRLFVLSNQSPWGVYAHSPGVHMDAILRRLTGGVFHMVRDPDGTRSLLQIPRNDHEREQMEKNLAESPFPGFTVYPSDSQFFDVPNYQEKPF